ncbi:MAG: hypothetical protein P8X50_18290, partial [Maritimibacter sp.]
HHRKGFIALFIRASAESMRRFPFCRDPRLGGSGIKGLFHGHVGQSRLVRQLLLAGLPEGGGEEKRIGQMRYV